MNRKFIWSDIFCKRWKELGFTEDDQIRLEKMLISDPHVGKVIPGTHGLRKMRFAFEGGGKRSGSRICYVDIVRKESIYVILVYSKNEQDDLTPSQIKIINNLIDEAKGE